MRGKVKYSKVTSFGKNRNKGIGLSICKIEPRGKICD